MENVKISVVMSVYNNGDYLEDAIESVLNQTYGNFEFLITNDKSNDSSTIILEKYAKADNRIKLIKNESNVGLTKSLNNMIKMARGEYIARMDGDDICLLNRFESQISILERYDIDLVFSGTTLIDREGSIICNAWRPDSIDDILKVMKIHNYIPHPSVMFKKELTEKFGVYDENHKTGQDRELWIKYINQNVKFYYIKDPLLFYRINPSSVRNDRSGNYDYKLANILISNRKKKESLKYIKSVTIKEKVLLVIRWLLPYKTIYFADIIKRFKKKMRNKICSV